MTCRLTVLALLAGFFPALADKPADLSKVAEADWPWWRGPAGDGRSQDRRAPTRWDGKRNVLWKTPVPGRGHSSPVLWGERLFLTTADEAAKTQSVLAFDRKTGKPLWTVVVHRGGLPRKNPKNSHASATPACDGERLICAFVTGGALHVTATDLAGKILWQQEAGSFSSEHGYGSSPVLWRGLVIVNGDSLKGCFVAALDRATGKVVWSTPRRTTGKHGSYATPLVATLAGKPQLILQGMAEVSSYDPATGKLLWSCEGPAEVTGCTPACSDRLVFATGGFPEKEILAIRADGAGDVTKTHVVWRTGQGVSYVPSPVYHDGKLYVVNDTGTATCFEAATGKRLWQGRVAGAFSSSPVLVGDLLYATSETGKTHVLRAGTKFAIAATNEVPERVYATLAICGGRIYLRGERSLYCIGE
jgi:outer membrane protein assembly factor BamB